MWLFKCTRLRKRFSHTSHSYGLLVRVNTHVLCQSTRITKSFIANIAFIRFLVRVNTHVPFQITRLTKTLLAHIAFVRSSRSCEYACVWPTWMDIETPSRKHRTRALSSSSLSSSQKSFLFASLLSRQESSNTTPKVLLPLLLSSSSSLLPFTTFKTVLAFALFGCGFFTLITYYIVILRLLVVVLKRVGKYYSRPTTCVISHVASRI